MSIAAAQYDKFREQVVAEERVLTFTGGGELLVWSGETLTGYNETGQEERS